MGSETITAAPISCVGDLERSRIRPARYRLKNETNPIIEAALNEKAKTYRRPTDKETQAACDRWVEFARTCAIISSRGVVPFDPYGYQQDLFKAFWQNPVTLVGKPRQHGFTEAMLNIFLFKAHEAIAYSAAIFSKNGDDTAHLSQRAKMMVVSSPLMSAQKSNTQELQLEKGGTILFRNSTPDGARSLASLNDAMFDEMAFAPDVKEIWTAATGAQTMLGDAARVVGISTPPPPEHNKKRQTFYYQLLSQDNGDIDLLETANQMRAGEIEPVQQWIDEDGACKFLVHWKAHPVYQKQPNHLEHLRKKLKLSKNDCDREHDLAFDAEQDGGIVNIDNFGTFSWNDKPAIAPTAVYCSWDTASTESKRSSYTAGITALQYGRLFYIVDVFYNQVLARDAQQAIVDMANKWNPHRVFIENKDSGVRIIQDLSVDPAFPFSISPVTPKRVDGIGEAKLLRFEQELPAIEDGRVWLPEKASWLDEFKSIIAKVGIPKNKEMDLPDALSQLLFMARENGIGRGT